MVKQGVVWNWVIDSTSGRVHKEETFLGVTLELIIGVTIGYFIFIGAGYVMAIMK
jgi:hypothetical protein